MPPKYYKKSASKKSASGPSHTKKDGAVYLVIVESPSKCRKIEDYLGYEYQCIASKGHIREIDGMRAINTKDKYQITFSEMEEKKSHIQTLKSIVKAFPPQNVYLATDDDREGEAIAWHICEVCGLSPETTKRILFHEITKPSILAAVAAPTTINMSMVYAQHSRQVLDIVVGYKISPVLWKHIHNNKTNGLSAGRCQTPALRLIYENEKANTGEVAIKHRIRGTFFEQCEEFDLFIRRPEGAPLGNSQPQLGNAKEYDTEAEVKAFLTAAKTHKYLLYVGETKSETRNAPKPFTTSALLQTASNIHHYSPKHTMELCQQLYQMGLITYMRTDSAKYSPVFLKSAEDYVSKEYGANYVGNHAALKNENAANPHEAIRVTNIHMKYISDENKQLNAMYALIWRNSVESTMAAAKYDVATVAITAPEDCVFAKKHEILRFLGWKAVSTNNATELTSAQSGQLLYYQSIQKSGANFPYCHIDSYVSVHGAHSHYSEASLIQKLEELGIGRPSTYASIVSTIQERGYVVKRDLEGKKVDTNEWHLTGNALTKTASQKKYGNEKNRLVIQPIGVITTEFLLQHFLPMFEYKYTGDMETKLDNISAYSPQQSVEEWYYPCKEAMAEIKVLMKPLAKMAKQDYPVNDEYSLVFHQYGASLRRTNAAGEFEYKPVKKSMVIDMEKLKRGEYSVGELLEIENDCLGKYEDEDVYLKTGKYGAYIVYGAANISVKTLKKELNAITLMDVVPFIMHHNHQKTLTAMANEGSAQTIAEEYGIGGGAKSSSAAAPPPPPLPPLPPSANVLREITHELSVRKGKFGAYIYYKTAKMATPQFYNLKKFKQGFKTCTKEALLEWIRETYNLDV